ncbi:uncharacterized protein LOC141900830 [Tubulanus polymorphus]|uniref:uncharacterized protein LOC141900830 n=1 Tax=Tubulanus polymorphus TaxID=672921 RepID=UPI003DA5E3E6
MEYIGLQIDSIMMMLKLPGGKIMKIREQCQQMLNCQTVTVRDPAKLIGKLTATVSAILPAPLDYRNLQMLKRAGLGVGNQSYETEVTLTTEGREDLLWWIQEIQNHNGKSVISPDPDLTITTDASHLGGGAVVEGTGLVTQGLWSPQEASKHINVLELMVVQLALGASAGDKENCHIHFRMDNSTAVAQINKMGSTRSRELLGVTKQTWQWCLRKGITLTAAHLPGVQNLEADRSSRVFEESSDWHLDPKVFKSVEQVLGVMEIDLFASKHNTQKEKYVSWKADPGAMAFDAFALHCGQLNAYLFPPFCLISRCLYKIRKDKACVTLVTPVWQTQPWYPVMLQLLVCPPVLLPAVPNLLTDVWGNVHPLVANRTLQLAAWRVSGQWKRHRDFLKSATRLFTLSWRQGTQSAYKSAWKKWSGWCDERQIDPLQASVESIGNFLAEEFESGKQYTTLNGYRSALSAFHPEIEC